MMNRETPFASSLEGKRNGVIDPRFAGSVAVVLEGI